MQEIGGEQTGNVRPEGADTTQPGVVVKEKPTSARFNPNIIFEPENRVSGSDIVPIPHGWITNPQLRPYLKPFLETADNNYRLGCHLGARELIGMGSLSSLDLQIASEPEHDSMRGPNITLGVQTPTITRGNEGDVIKTITKVTGVKNVTEIAVNGKPAGLGLTTIQSRDVVQITYGPTDIHIAYDGDISAPGNGVAQFETVLAVVESLAPVASSPLPSDKPTPTDQEYASQLTNTIARLEESIAMGEKINTSPEKWTILGKAVDLQKQLGTEQPELAPDLEARLQPLSTRWQALQAEADQLRTNADNADGSSSILDRIPVAKQLRQRARDGLRAKYQAAQSAFAQALDKYNSTKRALVDGEQQQRNMSQKEAMLNQELGLGITAKEFFARFDRPGNKIPLEDQLRNKHELLDILLEDQLALQ